MGLGLWTRSGPGWPISGAVAHVALLCFDLVELSVDPGRSGQTGQLWCVRLAGVANACSYMLVIGLKCLARLTPLVVRAPGQRLTCCNSASDLTPWRLACRGGLRHQMVGLAPLKASTFGTLKLLQRTIVQPQTAILSCTLTWPPKMPLQSRYQFLRAGASVRGTGAWHGS